MSDGPEITPHGCERPGGTNTSNPWIVPTLSAALIEVAQTHRRKDTTASLTIAAFPPMELANATWGGGVDYS